MDLAKLSSSRGWRKGCKCWKDTEYLAEQANCQVSTPVRLMEFRQGCMLRIPFALVKLAGAFRSSEHGTVVQRRPKVQGDLQPATLLSPAFLDSIEAI